MKFREYNTSKIHIDSILQNRRPSIHDPPPDSSSSTTSLPSSPDAQSTKIKGGAAATHFGQNPHPSLSPCGVYYLVANGTNELGAGDDPTELIWSVDPFNSTTGTFVGNDKKRKNQNTSRKSVGEILNKWLKKIEEMIRDLFLPIG